MSVCVYSGAVLGIHAYRVDVEVDLINGLPAFDLVGLAEGAVKESRIRIRSALKNSGYPYPLHSRKITVNLAPADIRKDGTGFDLPIAIGLLCALGIIPPRALNDFVFIGELALSGQLKPIRGLLPVAAMAREEKTPNIIVPLENGPEAAVVEGIQVFPMSSLGEVVDFLLGECECTPIEAREPDNQFIKAKIDFEDVKGQEHVKRALEVAASGHHNILMIGPPGSGKTMIARRISTILPSLRFEESLETSKIYSICGRLDGYGLLQQRPFRSPHHTISDAGLVGGGAIPKPGEISLAHNGVLFLDELPEFKRHVLEVLRQPLEEREVTLTRSAITLKYPSSFLLVTAMNPCPCGTIKGQCRCTPHEIHRYRSKISGPLLDRIDLHIEVPAVPFKDLCETKLGESSESIRERVVAARDIQIERYQGEDIQTNAHMSPAQIRKHCRVGMDGLKLLEKAVERLGMSARAYDRILKVSRTIADLEFSDDIKSYHIAEAIQYRSLDRRYLY